MGEIGYNRREYLYILSFCDILLISRGYFCRHHAGWEQARLVAYNAHYCMGSKTTPPAVNEWLPFPWEKNINIPTDEEIEEIRKKYLGKPVGPASS
ncbi:MAG: hypothetical protein IKY42_10095 [Bacteroidaceae bacterium]|nr:hypothetical protein [Bacteroidaceae bacterium]